MKREWLKRINAIKSSKKLSGFYCNCDKEHWCNICVLDNLKINEMFGEKLAETSLKKLSPYRWKRLKPESI